MIKDLRRVFFLGPCSNLWFNHEYISVFSDGLSSYIHSNINLMDPKSFKQNTSKEGTSSKKKKKEINQKSKPDSIVQVSKDTPPPP